MSATMRIKTKFNFGHLCMSKLKIRNTGITDKWGFRHTCYVATASQNLKDFAILVHGDVTSYGHAKKPK